MTDNDRKISQSTHPVSEPRLNTPDPFLELSQLFNFDNLNSNQGPNFNLPNDEIDNQQDFQPLRPAGIDTFEHNQNNDLTFLDSPPKENNHNHIFNSQEQLQTGYFENDELDFLPEDQALNTQNEPSNNLFNELYETPSISPKAQYISSPSIEPPFGFESDDYNHQHNQSNLDLDNLSALSSTNESAHSYQSGTVEYEDNYNTQNDYTKLHLDDDNSSTNTSDYLQQSEVYTDNIAADTSLQPSLQNSHDAAYQQNEYVEPSFDLNDFDTELENLLVDPIGYEQSPLMSQTDYETNSFDHIHQPLENNFISSEPLEQNWSASISMQNAPLSNTYAPISQSKDEMSDVLNEPFNLDNDYTETQQNQYIKPTTTDYSEETTPFISEHETYNNENNNFSYQPLTPAYSAVQNETNANYTIPTDQTVTPAIDDDINIDFDDFDQQFDAHFRTPTAQFDATNNDNDDLSIALDNFEKQSLGQSDNETPTVDTYKFADEIVETTEAFDIPEVAYHYDKPENITDSIEKEFADVFDVGTSFKKTASQEEQDNFFDDAIRQSGYNTHSNQYYSEETQTNGLYPFNQNSDNQNDYYKQDQYGASTHEPYNAIGIQHQKPSFMRKLIISGIALIVLFGGASIAYNFFKPNSDESGAEIIHADNTPIKVQPENNSTETSISNNQDVYNHASGDQTASQGEQTALLDNTEKPEDLTALNEQPPESTEPYANTSSIEDAIKLAANQSVPTREIQTVIVNPLDGTTKTVTPQVPTTTPKPEVVEVPQSNPTPLDSDTSTNTTQRVVSQPKPEPSIEPRPVVQKPTPQPVSNIATPASGGFFVQIASNPTQELANSSLNNVKKRYGSIIGSLPIKIEAANIPDKGTYYRVRIQAGSREKALSLCDELKTAGGSCFIGR